MKKNFLEKYLQVKVQLFSKSSSHKVKFMSLIGGIVGSFAIITEVFAEAAAQQAPETMGSNALSQGLMLAAFAAIFYFLILRPQSKRAKEHRTLVTSLQKGDEVLTTGGLLGKVTKVTDDFLMVSIADGIEVAVQKQAIAAVLPKGTMKSI